MKIRLDSYPVGAKIDVVKAVRSYGHMSLGTAKCVIDRWKPGDCVIETSSHPDEAMSLLSAIGCVVRAEDSTLDVVSLVRDLRFAAEHIRSNFPDLNNDAANALKYIIDDITALQTMLETPSEKNTTTVDENLDRR